MGAEAEEGTEGEAGPTMEKGCQGSQTRWDCGGSRLDKGDGRSTSSPRNDAPIKGAASREPHAGRRLLPCLTSPRAAGGTSPVLTVFQATNSSGEGPGLLSRAATATAAIWAHPLQELPGAAHDDDAA